MKKYWLSSLFPLSDAFKKTTVPVILPLYHTTGFRHDLPSTKYLYRNRTEIEFSHDLDYLLKHFEPVDLPEIVSQSKSLRTTGKPKFHITRDDGLSSNYELIAPILYKKGIPATFFINPAFLDDQDIMHRYKASLLIEWLARNHSGCNLIADLLKIPNGFDHIKMFLLDIRYPTKAILDECAEKLGLSWHELLFDNPLYLTTQQLQNIREAGFHIGAHSWDHPEFQLISLERQKEQTLKSLEYIREHFNPVVSSFAFPFTDSEISPEFFKWLHKQVDISFGCAGLKLDNMPRHLQRIPVEKYPYRIHDVLTRETGLFFLKKVLGKHIVKHV